MAASNVNSSQNQLNIYSESRDIENGPSSDRINQEDLHLDRVVSPHADIGPSPPDGGYGWLILVSAIVYHITTPGILILYGFIILKSLREDDHEDGEAYRIWDVDIAMVPVLSVVVKLLFESWCRTVVKLFSMPRFMALSGLCLTVAGVLLSSFSTNKNDNDQIVNVFAGIFIGAGCALTEKQTEVIITHYFRDKLTIAQRLVRIAPSLGNCLTPLVITALCITFTADVVVMIYGALLMQNCFFLASYTRPVYIEKVIRHTYNMIRDAVEDEDEVIFSNNNEPNPLTVGTQNTAPNTTNDDDDQVVVFKSKASSRKIVDSTESENRFSSDFSDLPTAVPADNRFSSDFSNFAVPDVVRGYRELRSFDQTNETPQPLYRETTINAPAATDLSYIVNPDMIPGTVRRTATMRRNFITLTNMIRDYTFYHYTLLHLTTTFSIMVLSVIFPQIVWLAIPSMNILGVGKLISLTYILALCGVITIVVLPKSLIEKSRLCAAFCATGAIGFYCVTRTSSRAFLVIWGMFASLSTTGAIIHQQPIYNNILNEFDTTATTMTANTLAATFVMVWSLVYNYEYKVCFYTASVLQGLTSIVFLGTSFLRQRR